MAIHKIDKERESLIRDIAIEVTVGGDRFDIFDIHSILVSKGYDDDMLKALCADVKEEVCRMLPPEQKTKECLDFYYGCVDSYFNPETYAYDKAVIQYEPCPKDLKDVRFSTEEMELAKEFASKEHFEWCYDRHLDRCFGSKEFNLMLFDVLPTVKTELQLSDGVLRNTTNGMYFDGKPFESYSDEEKFDICIEAFKAKGKLGRVSFSDSVIGFDNLSPEKRNCLESHSLNLVKCMIDMGYSFAPVRRVLEFHRAKTVSTEKFSEALGRYWYEDYASDEYYRMIHHDCLGKDSSSKFGGKPVPYDLLSENEKTVVSGKVNQFLECCSSMGYRIVNSNELKKREFKNVKI